MEPLEFSLCALYKNEERNLEKFLQNHTGLFDEWVMVDTGSTDRSNDIVKSFGITPHFFQWVNHFSIARNYSLTKATKPFIVVLDMDEQVLKEDFERLKTIIKESGKDVYSLLQVNFTPDRGDLNWKSVRTLPSRFHELAPGYIPSPLFRVFRNHKGVEFNGKIHELVGDSVSRLKLSSKITDVPIYHYGWLEARTDEEKKRKKETYREMIKQAWESDQSPKMAFYYLKTLEDSQEKIRLGFKLTKQFPRIKQYWEVMVGAAIELEQWDRALSYIQKGLNHHPGNTTLMSAQARCLNETAQPGQALEIVERLMRDDPGNPAYWFEKFRSLLMLGRKQEAQTLTRQFPPDFPPALARELSGMVNSTRT